MDRWNLSYCDNCGELVETFLKEDPRHVVVWYGLSSSRCAFNQGATVAWVMPETGQERLI